MNGDNKKIIAVVALVVLVVAVGLYVWWDENKKNDKNHPAHDSKAKGDDSAINAHENADVDTGDDNHQPVCANAPLCDSKVAGKGFASPPALNYAAKGGCGCGH